MKTRNGEGWEEDDGFKMGQICVEEIFRLQKYGVPMSQPNPAHPPQGDLGSFLSPLLACLTANVTMRPRPVSGLDPKVHLAVVPLGSVACVNVCV